MPMLRVALAMLSRDRSRYVGLLVALGFTALVLTQQPGFLLGAVARTVSMITDTPGVDLWVMDPSVRYVDDAKPMADGNLYRVRGVPGVASAHPFYKGSARARLDDGSFQMCELYAVDDASLVGAPRPLDGISADVLRRSDAVLLDVAGARTLNRVMLEAASGSSTPAPRDTRPIPVGTVLELNDARARVVGHFVGSPSFQSLPKLVTTWSRVRRFVPAERKMLSFVLVQVAPGADIAQVARAITAQTGLKARTADEFAADTKQYVIFRTGVITTFLASSAVMILIGLFIAAQTFRNFTIEHLKFFGAMAAMGASHGQLLRMLVAQAGTAGLVATAFGVGGASLVALATRGSEMSLSIAPWQLGATVIAMVAVCSFVAVISMRALRRLEPAAVFRA